MSDPREQQQRAAWQALEKRLNFVFAFFHVYHAKTPQEREALRCLAQSMRREAVQVHEAFIKLNIKKLEASKNEKSQNLGTAALGDCAPR